MIKFSIITVCYNAEKTIRKTIQSVLNQTYSAVEFLIIDGDSTDHTLDVLKEYSDNSNLIVCREKDSGIFNAMNKGIVRAKGNYIYFLNAGDTFYDENVLSNIAKYIILNQPDIVIGNYIEKKHEQSKIVQMKSDLKWNELLQYGTGVCHQAIFAAAECLKDGFDERYEMAADYDWLCRQVKSGRKVISGDAVVSEYDIYGVSGLAKNWKKLKEECKRIVEKNFPCMEGKIEDVINSEYSAIKIQRITDYLNDILALKQRDRSLKEYFENESIYEIGIYGFHHLGQRLYTELQNSGISVKYIIDRDHSYQNINVPFKYKEDDLEQVDLLVVTPIFEFYDIKKELQNKLVGKIISIEDVINYMYQS